MWQADVKVFVYAHGKTGGVRALCKAAAAPQIGISHKGQGIFCGFGPFFVSRCGLCHMDIVGGKAQFVLREFFLCDAQALNVGFRFLGVGPGRGEGKPEKSAPPVLP